MQIFLLILAFALMAYFYYKTESGCLSVLGAVAAFFLIGGVWNLFTGGEGIGGQIAIGIIGLLITLVFFRRRAGTVQLPHRSTSHSSSTDSDVPQHQPSPPTTGRSVSPSAPSASSSLDLLREVQHQSVPPPTGRMSPSSTPNTSSRIDLNNASEGELAKLPGIGIIMAKRAVKLRQERGGFQSIEDFGEALRLRSDIVERIRPQVSISSVQPSQKRDSSGRIVDY